MTVEYNSEIEEQILSHLDGWEIKAEPTPSNANSTGSTNTGEVQPFITEVTTYQDNPNKKVTSEEVENFYTIALDKAYVFCNRLNVDDLTSIEEAMFVKGVCLLAASDLWNKYNIRVNNEDMEDVYIQSYGGLLYKQAMNILHSFINQRVTGLSSLKNQNNNNDNIWII